MSAYSPSRSAALAAGATLLLPRIAAAQTLRTILVGGVVAEDTVPLWYAINTGMFRAAGLDVQYQKLANGSQATIGVVNGQFNVANTNPLSAINAHARNLPIVIAVFSGLSSAPTAFEYLAAVVKKDSPLQSAVELNGKVLGTSGVKDLASLALMNWMDKNGGDSRSLKVVEVPYSVVSPALEEGRIDVGTLLQPFLSQALYTNRVRVFANTFGAVAPRFVHSVWITSPAWAEANGDTLRRFARVMREAQVWANANRPETAKILAQNSGADVEAIARGGRETFTQAFADPKDLQPVIDVAAKYGAIERRFEAAEMIAPAVRGLR